MKYRKLGRTGIDIGIVGLGAEYLEHTSRDTVTSVVDEAIDNNVNYIDVFMASPGVRDNFGIALKNKRQKVMIAGHLGSAFRNNQYYRTRDKKICEEFINDFLIRLKTDYVDFLMLHFVDNPNEYEEIFDSGGILELALRMQKEGKARFIGMSSHYAPVALKAVNSGRIDVLMFPVNPAFDTLPGDAEIGAQFQESSYNKANVIEEESSLERRDLYYACAANGVGLVAMKPYAAGHLFTKGHPSSIVLTPVQCINYALSQPGVCTVVPGCKNVEEMKAALAFLEVTEAEKDYSAISENPVWKLRGSCMYCNHCLPCPMNIDIGLTTRLADISERETTATNTSEYEALPVKASDCTECGICMENCPFNVDVIANMARTVALFGK
ncbi:aldo/keto reductase [Chloroflexota bacterium]